MLDEHEMDEAIMGCQGIVDDLRALSWRLNDLRNPMDPEDLANAIQGIEVLYEIKFKQLWESYQRTFKN